MIRIPGILVTVLILWSLVCQLPEDIRNVDNAGIEKETLTAIPQKVPVNSVYTCTLQVLYPEFVDSFVVRRSLNSGTPEKIGGTPLIGDTQVVFSVHLTVPASYVVTLLVYKGYQIDSVSTSIVVFSTSPVVTAAHRRIYATVDSSALLEFNVTDADSNLFEYSLAYDITTVDKQQFRASERAAATIRKELSNSFLTQLDDTLKVFSVTVMDEDSQKSAVALCSLIVRDDEFPVITRLPPLADTVYTVKKLPDTLHVKVNDNWGIDSIKLGGHRVIFSHGDTVQLVINGLDSGITVDTLEAWDPAGNRALSTISLKYLGVKVHLPQVALFFQTVVEGSTFDTVFLDDKVTITDPEADYGKSSLRWSMTIDQADTGMVIHFDSLARKLFIEGPAGEIFHDRVARMSLTVTDPSGHSVTQHGATFIMVEKNDPPHITVKGQGKLIYNPFDTLLLDTCGNDPEKNSQLFWTIDRGTYFYPKFLYITRCTGVILGKTASRLPVCFDSPTGKVLILPDSAAVAKVPAAQQVISDTLRFILMSVTGTDTMETSRRIPFTWGRIKVVLPNEIPGEIFIRK